MKKLQKFEFHLRWRIEDIWLTVGEPLWSSLIWAQFLIRGKHKGSWKKGSPTVSHSVINSAVKRLPKNDRKQRRQVSDAIAPYTLELSRNVRVSRRVIQFTVKP
jgi:hypothetical protein